MKNKDSKDGRFEDLSTGSLDLFRVSCDGSPRDRSWWEFTRTSVVEVTGVWGEFCQELKLPFNL